MSPSFFALSTRNQLSFLVLQSFCLAEVTKICQNDYNFPNQPVWWTELVPEGPFIARRVPRNGAVEWCRIHTYTIFSNTHKSSFTWKLASWKLNTLWHMTIQVRYRKNYSSHNNEVTFCLIFFWWNVICNPDCSFYVKREFVNMRCVCVCMNPLGQLSGER